MKDQVWAVACFGFGILLACNSHKGTVSTAKPNPNAIEEQPVFTPVGTGLAQQKLCDEQAGKRFQEDKHSNYTSYTSHYDPTANVCYIRVNSTSSEKFPVVVDMVYDAFGGRVYANYMWIDSQNKKYREGTPSKCELDIPGKPVEECKSLEQFDALTEKYFGVTG